MASAAILEKFQMAISPQQLTIYLYSAHRAVIFAIAQLSCYLYARAFIRSFTCILILCRCVLSLCVINEYVCMYACTYLIKYGV